MLCKGSNTIVVTGVPDTLAAENSRVLNAITCNLKFRWLGLRQRRVAHSRALSSYGYRPSCKPTLTFKPLLLGSLQQLNRLRP